MNKLLTLAFCWFCGVACFAQDKVSQYEQKYPGILSVTLRHQADVTIDLVKDSVQITQNTLTEVLHLSERSNIYAQDQVFHSTFRVLQSLEAWSMVPDKKGFKKMPVTEFKDTHTERASIFYDDTRVRKFAYPGITRGTITTLKESMRFPNMRLLAPFYFHADHQAEEIRFTLKVHHNIGIDYKLFYCGPEVGYTTYTKGDYVYHQWLVNNQKALRREPNSPGYSFYASHILYKITQVKRKGGTEPVLGSLSDLYKWQVGFIKAIIPAPTQGYTELLNTIIKPTDSELAKVEKIYAWVQENIQYVAFEDGFGGFIPRDPALTYKNRYGDCKDMASLLYTLLKAAGIQSHLTWIGTRDLPYKISDFNTQHSFNHMIVAYIGADRTYYLDPTDRHGLFGYPSNGIQDKEALISLNENEYVVKKVEIPQAQANNLADTATFRIKEQNLIGSGSAGVTGYPKVMAAYRLADKIESEQNYFLKNLLNKGSNKFILSDFTISNVNNKQASTSVKYSCTIEDFVKLAQNEMYVNMNLNRTLDNEIIDTNKRTLAYEHPYRSLTNYLFKVEIPEGYKIDYLPEEKAFSDGKFGFAIKHSTDGQYIIYEKNMYLNVLMVEPADFALWNNFIRELSKTYRESVILKKD